MPKEKTTTRATKKGGKAEGGRKKKGKFLRIFLLTAINVLTATQTPTSRSAAFRLTCSSPTTSVTRSARKTLASSSVCLVVSLSSVSSLLTHDLRRGRQASR